MGIGQLLQKVLPVSRKFDLSLPENHLVWENVVRNDDNNNDNNDNPQQQQQQQLRHRPLRIGVDISTWLHQATVGYGNMLSDDRHLTNHGRAMLAKEMQKELEDGGTIATTAASSSVDPEMALLYVTMCTQHVLRRLQMLKQSTGADILVVMDGASPPIKLDAVRQRKIDRQELVQARDERNSVAPQNVTEDDLDRRTKAAKRAGAGALFPYVVAHLVQALRRSNNNDSNTNNDNNNDNGDDDDDIEPSPATLLVAPYEADAQLAFLGQQGYLDLIVTEDSDFLAYITNGARCPILYKLKDAFSEATKPKAADGLTTVRAAAIVAAVVNNENEDPAKSKKPETPPPLVGRLIRCTDLAADFNYGTDRNEDMSLVDFTGPMLAIVFAMCGCDYCDNLRGIGIKTAVTIVRQAFRYDKKNEASPLERCLQGLYEKTYLSAKTLTKEFKANYEKGFLSAIYMFRHAVVYDPVTRQCRQLLRRPDPELTSFPPYAALNGDPIVGELVPAPHCQYIAEGWIQARYPRPYPDLSEHGNRESSNSSTAADQYQASALALQALPEAVRAWLAPPDDDRKRPADVNSSPLRTAARRKPKPRRRHVADDTSTATVNVNDDDVDDADDAMQVDDFETQPQS